MVSNSCCTCYLSCGLSYYLFSILPMTFLAIPSTAVIFSIFYFCIYLLFYLLPFCFKMHVIHVLSLATCICRFIFYVLNVLSLCLTYVVDFPPLTCVCVCVCVYERAVCVCVHVCVCGVCVCVCVCVVCVCVVCVCVCVCGVCVCVCVLPELNSSSNDIVI